MITPAEFEEFKRLRHTPLEAPWTEWSQEDLAFCLVGDCACLEKAVQGCPCISDAGRRAVSEAWLKLYGGVLLEGS